MAKIRVYELAKELGLDNKEILAKLRALKIPVKTHMSVVPEEELEAIKKSLAESGEVSASGGVEEKRVARGVIRRRAVPAPPPEEEEPPKVDLTVLKQGPKRARREDGEEDAPEGKDSGELLEDIPREWAEESEEKPADKKKTVRKKKAADKTKTALQVEGEEQEAARKAEGRETKAGEKETEKAPPASGVEPGGEESAEAEAKPAKKAVPAKRRIYMKPSLRQTARAIEGEPMPIPGQAPPPKPAPATPEEAAAEELAQKKKKKKRGKAEGPEEGAVAFDAAAPKRKLRRKIAFKVNRGTEGMEIADVEQMYMPSRKKISRKKKPAKKTAVTRPKAAKRIVRMGETITVADLAKQLGVKSKELIRALMAEGVMAAEEHPLDADMAGIIASGYDYEISQTVFDEVKLLEQGKSDAPARLAPRPPVVTVMGHVDHGKTSLLDIIRKTRVTEEEAGAITQHIGTSMVETSSGKITFVDTPGHEAFTTMRARGAKVTDIVILVVAADDGIMPQTVEAANHAKAAGVPVIVAINKIDLPAAKPDVVKQRLSEVGLTPEDWGGDTQLVECSAKTGQGVPELLDEILALSEVLELSADPDKPARGLVIESRLDKGRGPVATVIIQEGTLRKGDYILCGVYNGKVRAMLDDRGKPVKAASPSMPVEIMGLSGVPEAGEEMMAVADEKVAKQVAGHRAGKIRSEMFQAAAPAKVSLEDLMARLEEGEIQELALIIKADTHGSTEAIKQSVEKLSREEVKVGVLHVGVGNITENDVLLASASNAVILGFQVKIKGNAAKVAEREGVQIRLYDIIYNLLDDVKASLLGMLKPVFEETVIGKAEVRKIFRVPKVGTVAGSYVTDGLMRRNENARVLRGDDIVYTGKIKSLRRITEDVREVAQGLECGITLDNFSKLEEGDVIVAYELIEKERAQ